MTLLRGKRPLLRLAKSRGKRKPDHSKATDNSKNNNKGDDHKNNHKDKSHEADKASPQLVTDSRNSPHVGTLNSPMQDTVANIKQSIALVNNAPLSKDGVTAQLSPSPRTRQMSMDSFVVRTPRETATPADRVSSLTNRLAVLQTQRAHIDRQIAQLSGNKNRSEIICTHNDNGKTKVVGKQVGPDPANNICSGNFAVHLDKQPFADAQVPHRPKILFDHSNSDSGIVNKIGPNDDRSPNNPDNHSDPLLNKVGQHADEIPFIAIRIIDGFAVKFIKQSQNESIWRLMRDIDCSSQKLSFSNDILNSQLYDYYAEHYLYSYYTLEDLKKFDPLWVVPVLKFIPDIDPKPNPLYIAPAQFAAMLNNQSPENNKSKPKENRSDHIPFQIDHSSDEMLDDHALFIEHQRELLAAAAKAKAEREKLLLAQQQYQESLSHQLGPAPTSKTNFIFPRTKEPDKIPFRNSMSMLSLNSSIEENTDTNEDDIFRFTKGFANDEVPKVFVWFQNESWIGCKSDRHSSDNQFTYHWHKVERYTIDCIIVTKTPIENPYLDQIVELKLIKKYAIGSWVKYNPNWSHQLYFIIPDKPGVTPSRKHIPFKEYIDIVEDVIKDVIIM